MHSSVFVQRCVSSFLGAGQYYISTCLLWSGEWGVSLAKATLQLYWTSPIPSTTLSIFPVLFSNLPSLSTLFFFTPSIFPQHSRSWVNLYCILNKGEIGFYKDAKNTSTPYNNEPLLNLSHCHCDITNGYKKKKNVFTLKWALWFFFTLHYFLLWMAA